MRTDEACVLDMLLASRRAVEAVEGRTLAEFLDDWRLQSIVQHQLMLLGEAVNRLSPGFRTKHTKLPWKAIAGQRDILTHQYDDVDLDAVWRIVTRELPGLVLYLETIAPDDDAR